MPRTIHKKLFRVQLSCDTTVPPDNSGTPFLIGPCPNYIITPNAQTLDIIRKYRLRYKAKNGYVDIYYSGFLDGSTIEPFPPMKEEQTLTFIVEATDPVLQVTDITDPEVPVYSDVELLLQRNKGTITRLKANVADTTEQHPETGVILLKHQELGMMIPADEDVKVLKNRATVYIQPPSGEEFAANEQVTLVTDNIAEDVVAEGRYNKITDADDPNVDALQVSMPVEHLESGFYIFKVIGYAGSDVKVYIDSKNELTRASAIIEIKFIAGTGGTDVSNYNTTHGAITTFDYDPLPDAGPHTWHHHFYYVPVP